MFMTVITAQISKQIANNYRYSRWELTIWNPLLKLSGSNGTVKAIFDGEAQVELYTMTGQLVRSAKVTNEFTQLVNSGAY